VSAGQTGTDESPTTGETNVNAEQVLSSAFLALVDELDDFDRKDVHPHALDWSLGEANQWLQELASGRFELSVDFASDNGLRPCLREAAGDWNWKKEKEV
jgi:hypothetical protein